MNIDDIAILHIQNGK